MSRTRSFIGIVALTLSAGLLTACGEDAASSGDAVKITFVLPALDIPYWNAIKEGAEAEANRLGEDVDVTFVAGRESTAQDQYIANLQDASVKGADVIAAVVNDGNAVATTVEQLVEDGIPVVTMNASVPESAGASTFIGTDEVEGGATAGEAMVQSLPNGGDVGILHCQAGNATSDARVEGFTQALEGTNLEIVSVLDPRCDGPKTGGIVTDMLSAHPDIVGIFSISDTQTVPAAQALEQEGFADQVTIIGYDAAPEVLPLIESGLVYGSVAQFPKKMGEEGVKAALAVARGDEVEDRINTGTELVTKENLADFEADQ